MNQHVRPAHYSQADLAIVFGVLFDLRQRIVVGIYYIVQKMDRLGYGALQLIPVDLAAVHGGGIAGVDHCPNHPGEVYRAEIARLVGQKRLLAARIGGFDHAHFDDGITLVHLVQKHHPRLPGSPGMFHDQVENLFGFVTNRLPIFDGCFLSAGIEQIVVSVIFHRLHEAVGHCHGDIEVGQLGQIVFAGDELQDVGMVHPQYRHVGAPAGASLLDRLGGGVDNLHERDGSGGHSAGGCHRRVSGP